MGGSVFPFMEELLKDAQFSDPFCIGLVVTGMAVMWLALFPRKRLADDSGRKPIASAATKGSSMSPSARSQGSEDSQPISRSSSGDGDLDAQRQPNLHGAMIPSTGPVQANNDEPYPFDNSNCSGLFLPLHRPTHDKELDKSGDWRYGDHFRGRSRVWELRIQFRFKQDVKDPFLIGVELEDYVPLAAPAKKLMGMTVAALRQVAGSDLYHSVGDDPSKSPAPHEKPVFMMPLWATDQLIVTPEGEEPPDLRDPNFIAYGQKRADDRKAFVQEIGNLQLKAGPVYTFGFWGISQFLDVIKWEIRKVMPFKTFDFNMFCGKPPVHVVFYTLDKTGTTDDDKRHLSSRKNYFFRFAIWSSQHKPSREKMRELIPHQGDLGSHHAVAARKNSFAQRGLLARWFGCCALERSA